MAINDDLHRYKDVLKKQISHAFRIYLSIAIILSPLYLMNLANAAGQKSPAGWSKTIELVPLDDVIEATARKQAIRNGSSVTLEAVVRETVNRHAAGKVLLSRILGGGLAIGGMAALISAVGWVMEDGVYVKYKQPVSEPSQQPLTKFYYRTDTGFDNNSYGSFASCKGIYSTISTLEACLKSKVGSKYTIVRYSEYSKLLSDAIARLQNSTRAQETTISSNLYMVAQDTSNLHGFSVMYGVNPDISPDKDNKPKRIVLTSDLVGDLAVGDYTDPVDSQYDKKDRKWTGVGEAYDYDSTGVGNDLSDSLDSKFDSAPELVSRPDGKPQTDAPPWKYPVEKGTEGTTDQEKDADGNPTGKGSFQLPAFCTWAATMCQWYSDWKTSDVRDGQFQESVKKHNDEEKSFWQKVTDFFDWFKEDPPDRQPQELDIQEPEFEAEQVNLQGSTDCPQDSVSFSLMGKSYTLEMPYQPVCNALDFFRPAVLAVGAITSAYIIAGIRTKEDES